MEEFYNEVEDDGKFNIIDIKIRKDGPSYCDLEIIDHDTRGSSEILTMFAQRHGAQVAGFDVNDNGNIEVTINEL